VYGAPDEITLAFLPVEANGLIYIAQDRGFFSQNGLNVTLVEYTSATDTIQALETGAADFASTSEYPVVGSALNQEKIRIIGTIDKFQTQNIIARKDRGIESISDLKGKKIGVAQHSIREFYLGRFLTLHGLSQSDVTLVNVVTSASADALRDGQVDAIIYFQPYAAALKDELGNNGIIWPAQSSQLTMNVITCTSDRAAGHPATVTRFIRSLKLAEDYRDLHPSESRVTIGKKLNFTESEMATLWPDHQYTLTLDQSLITSMEDEARWMIANNLTEEKMVPDFARYISTQGMDEVKPGSVRIIG
jgi:NitT/TauT family transport system substrate-binding protein